MAREHSTSDLLRDFRCSEKRCTTKALVERRVWGVACSRNFGKNHLRVCVEVSRLVRIGLFGVVRICCSPEFGAALESKRHMRLTGRYWDIYMYKYPMLMFVELADIRRSRMDAAAV